MKNNLKIGLALGGGGALGFAHIGLLQVLQEKGIDIDVVSGTSSGAIIGGLFCLGMPLNEIELTARTLKMKDIFSLNIFKLLSEGVINDKKVIKFLKVLTLNKNIEDMPKKYCAVSTDLKTGDAVVIDKGNLTSAIRKSIGIPGVFAPIKENGKIFVDGSMSNNIPYDVLKPMGADVVVAIDPKGKYELNKSVNNVFDYLSQSIESLQYNKEQSREKCFDLKINIDNYRLNQLSISEEKIDYLINCGREAMQLAMPTLNKILINKINSNDFEQKVINYGKNNEKIK